MNKINFKIKAIKTDRKYYTTGNGRFTKDKIYEFKNGCTMWDNSEKSDCYNDFEEFINSNDNFQEYFQEYFQELYKNASENNKKSMEIKEFDKSDKALEEIDVIYNGKKRNINKLTEESNNIKNEFKDLETGNLLYKDYLKLKDRQYYLNKRLPIETNELRGLEIARKILLKNTNTIDVENYNESIVTLNDYQMMRVTNELETIEYGWHCDGCDCGEFQIEVEDIGFLVIDRSCRKSSGTSNWMQFSFGSVIPVYNKSIINEYMDTYTYDDFKEQGIKQIGEINSEQTQIILEYAKQNTIKNLGYDEYGNVRR